MADIDDVEIYLHVTFINMSDEEITEQMKQDAGVVFHKWKDVIRKELADVIPKKEDEVVSDYDRAMRGM